MRCKLLAFALASALLAVSPESWSAPPHKRTASTRFLSQPRAESHANPGRSLGSPTDGHLIGGVRLEENRYVRISPAHTGGDVRWGLGQLVAALDRAAMMVDREYPGSVLVVGHLSRRGGGEIEMHHSHESGRDADVQFYVRSRSGRQLLSRGFIPFRVDGTSAQWPGAQFDDERNWTLVRALVTDPRARVRRIFVAEPLRARLLQEADRTRTPAWIRVRAAQVMMQPKGALPHDDHFHVRVGCPPGARECVESPGPTHPITAHGSRLHNHSHPNRQHSFGPTTTAPTNVPARVDDADGDGSGEAEAHDALISSDALDESQSDGD